MRKKIYKQLDLKYIQVSMFKKKKSCSAWTHVLFQFKELEDTIQQIGRVYCFIIKVALAGLSLLEKEEHKSYHFLASEFSVYIRPVS